MKTNVCLLLLIFTCFLSCKKDKELENPIAGSWNLMQKSGGLAGIEEDYNVGDIIYAFDTDNVKIVNNISSTENEYPYQLMEHENKFFLEIGESQYYSQVGFIDDMMIIDPSISRQLIDNDTIEVTVDDGFIYSLEKQF